MWLFTRFKVPFAIRVSGDGEAEPGQPTLTRAVRHHPPIPAGNSWSIWTAHACTGASRTGSRLCPVRARPLAGAAYVYAGT